MTWKSYAAVSGATVLAGWFAASPPENSPAPPAPAARPPANASQPAADIQAQADRLQARLRVERDYTVPQRNPFRFEAGGAPEDVERGTAFRPEPEPEPEAAPIEPAPPALTLSGIAEDQVDGEVSRTAVVSAPSGVELVREGDQLLGYRVARIESDAVELVRVADGSTRRLTLRR